VKFSAMEGLDRKMMHIENAVRRKRIFIFYLENKLVSKTA